MLGNVCVVFAVGMRLRPGLLMLALVASLAGAAPADAASARWPRPQRYSLALRYDAGRKTLSGSERVAFLNDGPRTLGTVWLRVWPNAYGSCSHRWARVDVVSGGRAAGFARSCTALRVRLARPLLPGSRTALGLRIRVTVPPRPDRFGSEAGVAYFGNALPLLAVQDAGSARIEPYTDIGDPFYSLSTTWSVRLDVPPGLAAATTGAVTRTQRVARRFRRLSISAAHARDFAIVLGRMTVESTRTAGGVGLRRYRLPGQARSAALRALAVARAAVEQYSAWFGPLGDRQIDLVASPSSLGPFGLGMEYPGLVLTGDPPELIAHELAHQWWYGVVGDDQWRSPWLDESFAEYAARRLPASVAGPDDLHCNTSNPVAPFGDIPLTASMARWNAAGSGPYYRVVYLGGTCALRSLEHDIGSAAMAFFLRSYLESHRYGVTTTADFIAALRAAAPPGYDVDAYLRRARIEGS